MTVKMKAAPETGAYDLLVDGARIGRVRKRTERYNLRRVYVITWWEVEGVAGFNDGSTERNRHHHFDRRSDAIIAVEAFLNRQET